MDKKTIRNKNKKNLGSEIRDFLKNNIQMK